jgi:hypothetical protein
MADTPSTPYPLTMMSIVEQQLVDIEIVTIPGKKRADLRLKYQGQTYHLHQAFAEIKLAVAQQQWQQLKSAHGDGYLLVREVGYYSLWEMDGVNTQLNHSPINVPKLAIETSIELELQQASLCFFQELWLRLEDLIGSRQLQSIANNLFIVVPRLESVLDLDRLLNLDPLSSDRLEFWTDEDLIVFDRQLDLLTQQKLGRQFGAELVLDVIQSIPEPLRGKLTGVRGQG